MNITFIVLFLLVLSGFCQPANTASFQDISLIKKECTYIPPASRKEIGLFGFTPKINGWNRIRITLKVGVNSSQLSDLNTQYEESKSFSDVFDHVDVMALMKESYRIKIRITKTFKIVVNAQVLGFDKFKDKSSVYSMGVVRKF